MIGIELRAPSSRVARLNWRLIHMASEGLFPQLIVIPLHRDHGVITMAAGKNDVIKLLPPLTLSEPEARSFLGALDAVLADCQGAASKNWARRARHRHRDAAPPAAPTRRSPARRRSAARRRSVARRRLPRHGRDRVHRRAPGAAARAGGPPGALPRAREQRHVAARRARRRDRGRRPDERALAAPRRRRAAATCCTAARWSPTGPPSTRSRASTSRARGTCSRPPSTPPCSASSTSAPPTSTAIPAARRSTRPTPPRAFATGTRRPSWRPRPRSAASTRRRALDAVILRPATVYGPALDGGRRRDRAGDPRRQHAPGRRRSRGRRPVLRRQPRRRRGPRAPARRRARPGLQRQRRPRRHVAGVHRRPGRRPRLLARPLERAVLAGRTASASRSSTATGLLRRTTRLTTPPLLSRQAVHVLGRDQDFSNRKARELLGWEPRVDYAAGLEATVAWLKAEHLSARTSALAAPRRTRPSRRRTRATGRSAGPRARRRAGS